MSADLEQQFREQIYPNGYELTDGVAMHAENGDQFMIPHPLIKKYVNVGHFIELRIVSSRFTTHEEDAEKCPCPSCNGINTNPILSHEHPNTLVPLPDQNVPSRGWGEDFWVQVTERSGDYFVGAVDNILAESKLHQLSLGDSILFHENHILALHGIHREEIVLGMDPDDLKAFAQWLGSQQDGSSD